MPTDQALLAQQARDTLDAIRLALEAGANVDSQLQLVRELVEKGPAANEEGTESTRLLIAAIRELGAIVSVP